MRSTNHPRLRRGFRAALLIGAGLGTAACAETGDAPAESGNASEVPRTPDGRPDLQGEWTNGTMTPLQRPEDEGLVLTADEVAAREGRRQEFIDDRNAPSDPDREAPPVGGDGSTGAAGGVGGYNYFWIDAGDRVAVFNGEPRSSLLTFPEDGRIPELTPEGQRRRFQAYGRLSGAFDNPENRPIGERCILSFGSNAGPPMLPNYFYNNNYTIVQTPDHIMILTEMVHDARIIRMGEPKPAVDDVRPWFGESWGRWEGDTLVVRTTKLNPDQMAAYVYLFGPGSENMTVTERFTRADEHTINYEFTVEDPDTFVESWGGEVPFTRLEGQIYEYACHEGNYALSNVLSGARAQERAGDGASGG